MGMLFSKPKPPEAPKAMKPIDNSQADENAANQERLRRLFARGRQSTIFAGPSVPAGYKTTMG